MVTDKFQKERNLINLQHRLQNDLSKATKMVPQHLTYLRNVSTNIHI